MPVWTYDVFAITLYFGLPFIAVLHVAAMVSFRRRSRYLVQPDVQAVSADQLPPDLREDFLAFEAEASSPPLSLSLMGMAYAVSHPTRLVGVQAMFAHPTEGHRASLLVFRTEVERATSVLLATEWRDGHVVRTICSPIPPVASEQRGDATLYLPGSVSLHDAFALHRQRVDRGTPERTCERWYPPPDSGQYVVEKLRAAMRDVIGRIIILNRVRRSGDGRAYIPTWRTAWRATWRSVPPWSVLSQRRARRGANAPGFTVSVAPVPARPVEPPL